MSRGGRSDEIDVLRRRIAAIESRGAFLPSHRDERSLINLGEGCTLDSRLDGGLGRSALHEILPGRPRDAAAASGFALALSARFAASAGTAPTIVWIQEDGARRELGALHGPGLRLHGLDPARLVLVHARDAKESLWSLEEALKCRAAAVVAEIWTLEKAYDLTASRRLVLAAQKSGTPALLLAPALARGAHLLSSGAETRFEIFSASSPRPTSLPDQSPDSIRGRGVPLPGLASWSIRIVKARAGPHGTGFDRDRCLAVSWDHEKACFRDTLPFALAALPRHRPDDPAETRSGLAHIA